MPSILARWPALKDVVDGVGVALQESVETREELLHELLVLPLGVGEERVVGVRRGRENLAGLALAVLAP